MPQSFEENHILKLYTDRTFLPVGTKHCQLLFPFWGEVHQHDGYDEFIREGAEYLQLCDAADADFALLPFDGSLLLTAKDGSNREAVSLAARFIELARAAHLRTIVLINADSDEPLPFADVVVFRTSLNRRNRRSYEFALPAWHEDLVQNYLDGRITVRKLGTPPAVGFCGHAASEKPSFRRRIKNLARQAGRPLGLHIIQNDGVHMRQKAISLLESNPSIRTNFIIRNRYFGGGLDNNRSIRDGRLDFVNNLVESDYALCVRGYGNFSFRFFEAMSLGRIPLLIDTDCVLPYDFLHDYNNYCVIIPEARVEQCAELTLKFHRSIAAENYGELQDRIRQFWLNWLSPQGFFRNLRLHLNLKAGREVLALK